MTATIINGAEIAKGIRNELQQRVTALTARGLVPGLSVVLVGAHPASVSYVTGKRSACAQLGIRAFDHDLPADLSTAELLMLIAKLNADPAVHGILVQLPLPPQIDESKVLLAIAPEKDVDGLHPFNLGLLMQGRPRFVPCTPHGIQQLLLRSGVTIAGKDVVIVGRSQLVGKPLANLLSSKASGANATVTLCHTHTTNLAEHTRRADILIVAAGKPKAVTADMVRSGAVVIDVGTNRIGTSASGKARLCGDVDFEAVAEKAAAITPVPGGVGPLTITMLMYNTVLSAEQSVR
jgi:methylenetetrahydrofolate dehydrogenase (NADP+) / methenyltetrahydrofolate cyclohydrolase